MNLPNIPGNLKLSLTISAVSFLAAGLKPAMFGDGSLTWPQFELAWCVLILGLVGACASVIHSYFATPPPPVDTGKTA